jgi:biopolymer transport protein ExbD
MRLETKKKGGMAEGDMTPMIDMVFQLIAFFMVLVNFSDAEQSELITLPSSELAQPPEAPLEKPITLQITGKGAVLYGGREVKAIDSEDQLGGKLDIEVSVMREKDEDPTDATIIIRADRNTEMGVVQEVVGICQEKGFEKFVFRAKQETKKG